MVQTTALDPKSFLSNRGFTLAEVLIASALSMIILFGLIALDASRMRLTVQTQYNAGTKYPERNEASVSTLRITRELEQGDRFAIIAGGAGIQIRRPVMTVNLPAGSSCVGVPVPDAECFDAPQNYQWFQISRLAATGALRYYRNISAGCGTFDTLVQGDLSAVSFAPDAQDPNVVTYSLTWQNPDTPGDSMAFPGEVAVRGRTMGTTTGDAGITTGGFQAPWTAGGAPAACPT